MHSYRTYAPGFAKPVEVVNANSSWEARQTYARRHNVPVSDVLAIRLDFSPTQTAWLQQHNQR